MCPRYLDLIVTQVIYFSVLFRYLNLSHKIAFTITIHLQGSTQF